MPPVIVAERKLKCGLHNTWKFINNNGIDNVIGLYQNDDKLSTSGNLYFKGVLPLDNYLKDDSIAFVMEFVYTSKS